MRLERRRCHGGNKLLRGRFSDGTRDRHKRSIGKIFIVRGKSSERLHGILNANRVKIKPIGIFGQRRKKHHLTSRRNRIRNKIVTVVFFTHNGAKKRFIPALARIVRYSFDDFGSRRTDLYELSTADLRNLFRSQIFYFKFNAHFRLLAV